MGFLHSPVYTNNFGHVLMDGLFAGHVAAKTFDYDTKDLKFISTETCAELAKKRLKVDFEHIPESCRKIFAKLLPLSGQTELPTLKGMGSRARVTCFPRIIMGSGEGSFMTSRAAEFMQFRKWP